jgi:DNA-binding CsgD family transcriptional regulator
MRSKVRTNTGKIFTFYYLRIDSPSLISVIDITGIGEAITESEREALQWIAQGLSSKQVAEKMMISFHTAETYRKHLLEKFESKNSAELIKKASRMFWLK